MRNWTIVRRKVAWPSRFGVIGDILRATLGAVRVHHVNSPTYGVQLDWWDTVRQTHSKLTGVGITWGRKGLLWIWPIQFVRRSR